MSGKSLPQPGRSIFDFALFPGFKRERENGQKVSGFGLGTGPGLPSCNIWNIFVCPLRVSLSQCPVDTSVHLFYRVVFRFAVCLLRPQQVFGIVPAGFACHCVHHMFFWIHFDGQPFQLPEVALVYGVR